MAGVRTPPTRAKNGVGRKPSARVKEMVEFDEKRHMAELKNDIQHGVAHTGALNELEERVNDLGESWETESIFEDVLDNQPEEDFFPDGMFCVVSSCSPWSPLGA